MAHHERGLVRAPLPVQLMAAAAGSTHGGAWEQQPLWRLQSAPVTLHLTSADSVRSSTGCVYMYAALQDKSLHKYKLVVPTTMSAAQAKVRLIPPTVLLIDLFCGPQLHAALAVLLPLHANLRDFDASPSKTCKSYSDLKHQRVNFNREMSSTVMRTCPLSKYFRHVLQIHRSSGTTLSTAGCSISRIVCTV